MNADDRLSLASLGRVEGGDGIVESRDVADVRPQSTIPHPLDDLTQLGAIGYDDEVDSQAARGPRLGDISSRRRSWAVRAWVVVTPKWHVLCDHEFFISIRSFADDIIRSATAAPDGYLSRLARDPAVQDNFVRAFG